MRQTSILIASALVVLHGVAAGQIARSECDFGSALADLNVNGVRATLSNTGILNNPYRGDSWLGYEVPAGSGITPLFNTELWFAGLIDGKARMITGRGRGRRLVPGPIADGGTSAEECDALDRIYTVSRADINYFDTTGVATQDMVDWPFLLGAPVEDGDGNPDNYDLQAGDRPKIEGHQTAWMMMNDTGGYEEGGQIGLEFRVSVSAAASPDSAIEFATLYRFRLTMRGPIGIDSVYFGQNVDFDAGNPEDDFVGSDSVLGLAYAYNGDDFDENRYSRGLEPILLGYGSRPAAVGVAILDGVVGYDGSRLPMTNMFSDLSAIRAVRTSRDLLNLMRSIRPDGRHFTRGGSGDYTESPVDFMYSDDPPSYWSEEHRYPEGYSNTPGNRSLNWSTGPFSIAPGESREIVFAILWARGTDRYDSIRKLKSSVVNLREAYDSGFETPLPVVPTERPTLLSPGLGVGFQPLNLELSWTPVPNASRYQVQIRDRPERPQVAIDMTVTEPSARVKLEHEQEYFWRVRGLNAGQQGPWSDFWHYFTTGTALTVEPGPLTYGQYREPAVIQVKAPGNSDPCHDPTSYDAGCLQFGGKDVYNSLDASYTWVLHTQGAGPLSSLRSFAGSDYEIRFTEMGSYAAHFETTNRAIRTPFEVWDVGDVGPFGINDTTDDVQLIGGLVSPGGGECLFGFGETGDGHWTTKPTDRISAYYPTGDNSYEDWRLVVQPIVESAPNHCVDVSQHVEFVDVGRGPPLQGIVFTMDPEAEGYRPEGIPSGNIIRFLTSRPTRIALSSPMPQAHSTESQVAFWWQVPYDTTAVRFQLSRDFLFRTINVDTVLKGDNIVLDLASPGAHYWRVAYAIQPDRWSDVWSYDLLPVVSNEPSASGFPQALTIRSAYPNPASTSANIEFGMETPEPASLTVYDILGRRVETILNETMSAGWHTVRWDSDGVSAGIYFLRLETARAVVNERLVVTR